MAEQVASARWWSSGPATRAWPPPVTWPAPAWRSWCSRPATASADAPSPRSPRPEPRSTGAGSGSARPRTTWPRWRPNWAWPPFPPSPRGRGSSCARAGRDLYVGLIPTSDPEGAADGIACMLDLDLAAFEVPVDAPWDAADAAALDAQTLATYFDTHLTSPSARAILEVAVKAIFGTGSGELSLLFTLFYLHAGGGLTNLARTTGGAQERRFAGGSQQLAEGMAAELDERVLLGAPVQSVTYGPDDVTVRGRLVPPGADPADPGAPARARAGTGPPRHLRHGAGALRPPPLLAAPPREQGSALPAHADGRRHQGARGLRRAVLAGRRAQRADRRAGLRHGERVRQLARRRLPRRDRRLHRGRRLPPHGARPAPPPARPPCSTTSCAPSAPGRARRSKSWSSTGPPSPSPAAGPSPSSAPGALTDLGPALRAPVGPLHWAGTETATQWCGYLDGALSAGSRAADEVLHALKGEPVGLD